MLSLLQSTDDFTSHPVALVARDLITLTDKDECNRRRHNKDEQASQQAEHEVSQRRSHRIVPWRERKEQRRNIF